MRGYVEGTSPGDIQCSKLFEEDSLKSVEHLYAASLSHKLRQVCYLDSFQITKSHELEASKAEKTGN